MSKTSNKSKRMRADGFPIPKKMSSEDFDLLCRNFHIPLSSRNSAREQLDNIVRQFADWMIKDRKQPDRNADRDRLETALSCIEKATDKLNKLGPSGRLAFKAISRTVAPMLSAKWINENFSDDDYAPRKSRLPVANLGLRTPARSPMRGAEYFIEEHSLEARLQFVSHQPANTAGVTLTAITDGVREALRRIELEPGSQGGRKPFIHRRYLLMNLAEMWDRLGSQVSTGPQSNFANFCEFVAESIGWPTEGISSAIAKAIGDWRNLPGNKR
jgi:hypothetical protein